jgi:SAM-dependent methyltransferase
MGGWFGALYRESTAGLLGPRLSTLEADVIWRLLRLQPGERVLDIACGEGRHLAALSGRGLRLVGVDADRESLISARAAATSTATSTPTYLRADLRALPFRTCFDAAYCWYSSLFLFDDQGNERALTEAGRVLRPGGRLLVQHANPARLAAEPEARASRVLPGGGRVEETSRYDAARGVETLSRTLRDGARTLAGTAHLRYYKPTEWERLAPRAGLRLRSLASAEAGGAPCTERSLDLIAVLEKPT